MGYFNSDLIHGGRAHFYVTTPEGREVDVAFGAGVTVGEDINYEEAQVLDELKVAEFIPTSYRVTLTATMFAFSNKSLKGMGIQPTYSNILTSGEMSARIHDSISNTDITVTGVKMKSRSLNLATGSLEAQNVEFVATMLFDSDEV